MGLENVMLSEISQRQILNDRLPRWLSGKEPVCNVGDLGLIPGLGRSLGEGHSNLLQYSCLKSPMDKGTRQATVHWGHKQMGTTEQLNITGSLMCDWPIQATHF